MKLEEVATSSQQQVIKATHELSHTSDECQQLVRFKKNKGWFTNNGSCILCESTQQDTNTTNAHCCRWCVPKKLVKAVTDSWQQTIKATHKISHPSEKCQQLVRSKSNCRWRDTERQRSQDGHLCGHLCGVPEVGVHMKNCQRVCACQRHQKRCVSHLRCALSLSRKKTVTGSDRF